ncbi:MAG: SOS response-associated peptidase [Rhodanobacteraceae bacterium]|nr:MAG: SOS response-associated peptidase [Rhodanobacteraceae bacterium]
MCGRFVQLPLKFPERLPWPELAGELQEMNPRYNLAPTQRAAVVLDEAGKAVVRKLRWGLLPRWIKDTKQSYSMINARIETVATKPAYRAAFKSRRCLIPMAGYYEWRDTPDGKQPYFIAHRDGIDLFAAGLWEPRHRLQRETEEGSCTVITRDARDEAGTVHDRMPVFLEPDAADRFMRAGPDEAMEILMASPTPPLEVRAVSRRVNGVKEDEPSLLDVIDRT